MNQYLYRIQPTRAALPITPTPAERVVVGEHFDYLQSLSERGIVLHAGRTLETVAGTVDGFGIIVFMAADDDAAKAIMAADPAVQKGIMSATLYSYRTALGHPLLGGED